LIDDVTGGEDEPRRPVASRRRGLGKGLGAILPSPGDSTPRARHDQLTGLPNRSVLDERFEEAFERCRIDRASLAVLVVALDGFSDINESFGHRVGDDLLHEAAERLSAARRRSDTVARFAGDEFAVVCPYVASSDFACQLAARMLEDLSRPTTVDGVEHHLSASIGVVITAPGEASDDEQSLETLLGDASLAMRRAKDEGGGSWWLFDPTLRENVALRSQSRQDLRSALDDGGLVLEYEPIVDLETGDAIGESALLGWRQPGAEVDSSRELLDLADEAGLAGVLGRWMLDRALADLNARSDRSSLPKHFRVWVRVAPSFVADMSLVETVDELLAKHEVPASMLGLDIKEPSAAMVPSTVSALRALQVRDLAMVLDDFGAGPSNLAMLQQLPVTGLKLAPELIARVGEEAAVAEHPSATVHSTGTLPPAAPPPAAQWVPPDERDEAIGADPTALVRGLVELGRALGLTVVAQGVEGEAQVEALRAVGCEYAQGPFLGVVSPASGVPPRIQSRPPPDPSPIEPEPEALWATGTTTTGP